MPNRILRDDILRSDRLEMVSGDAESFYFRLMVCADDLGRFEAHGATLAQKCFPKRIPPVTRMASFAEFISNVDGLLKELVEAKLVFLYDVGNERFGVFYKWRQRLRIMRKKYPDPPDEVLAECFADDDDSQLGGQVGGQVGGVNPKKNPKKNPRKKVVTVAGGILTL